jgi:hypothetical protein
MVCSGKSCPNLAKITSFSRSILHWIRANENLNLEFFLDLLFDFFYVKLGFLG